MELEKGLLASTEISVEMKLGSGTNTSLASLPSFDLSQHDSIEQILLLLQQQNKQIVRM